MTAESGAGVITGVLLRRYVVVFALVAACCAALVFRDMDALLATASNSYSDSLLHTMGNFLILTSPIAVPVIVAYALRSDAPRLLLPILHASAISCVIVFSWITLDVPQFRDEEPLIDDGLASVFFAILFFMAAVELFVALILAHRQPWLGGWLRLGVLYVGLTGSILLGSSLGFAAWAHTIPERVIAAAEALAGERPYCLRATGREAQSRGDLSPWTIRGPDIRGDFRHVLHLRFYWLLAIEDSEVAQLRNWSYVAGRFVPLSGRSLPGLAPCLPTPHFGVRLPR